MPQLARETRPNVVDDPSSVIHAGDGPRTPSNIPTAEESLARDIKESSKSGETKPPRPEIPELHNLEYAYDRCWDVYTEEEASKAWSDAAGMVQIYSDEMIKRWKEEIDTYLVFAGLFSAVLTTFNVQTYVLLNPAPPDPSFAVLQQISSQLASFSVHPPFVNSTRQPGINGRTDTDPSAPIPGWVVWLNAFWFSGLILSLASATIGIMVKQWTNEYASGVAGTSRHAAQLRQHRLSGLKKWRVEDVVSAIPVLLQLALSCFLAGLLILLWKLHHTVATISSALVGLLGLFVVVTTLLPLLNSGCAYLTPQGRALYSLWQPKRLVHSVLEAMRSLCRFLADTLEALSGILARLFRHVSVPPIHFLGSVFRVLAESNPCPTSWQTGKLTWKGRERFDVDNSASKLDVETLVEAYSVTLHPDALDAATVCLMKLKDRDVLEYFRRLHRSAQEHFGAATDSRDGPLGRENRHQSLWLQIALCLLYPGTPPTRLSDEEQATLKAYLRGSFWPSEMKVAELVWEMTTINAITSHLKVNHHGTPFLSHEWLTDVGAVLMDYAKRTAKDGVEEVLLQAMNWSYCDLRCNERHIVAADTSSALATYIRSIAHFLRCANKGLNDTLPAEDRETVRTYTRDVLERLTRTLLDQFTEERVQHIQASIDAGTLEDVVWRLTYGVSDDVLQCITDELLPDVLRLCDILLRLYNYGDDYYEKKIREYAEPLRQKVRHIKGIPKSATPEAAPTNTGNVIATVPTRHATPSQERIHGHPSEVVVPLTTQEENALEHASPHADLPS